MAKKFKDLGTSDRAYLGANQGVIDVLESMTSVELAQSVPYVKIWQIEPGTGRPVHAESDGRTPKGPLSMRTVEPPRFGAPADIRFRERPPVSLDRLSVKTNSTRGVFTNTVIEISFTVHRPDVIFEENPPEDRDSWSTIITPGLMHVVEYGWQGSGDNPLLNGQGYESHEGSFVSIPAKKRVAFTVTDYNFSITTDMQMKFTVQAWENGDVHLRTANLGNVRLDDDKESDQVQDTANAAPLRSPTSFNDRSSSSTIKELQKLVTGLKTVSSSSGKLVQFREFADVLLAPVAESALRESGFKEVNLYLGTFNRRCGKAAKPYGGVDLGEKSIGEFLIPLDWIQQKFSELIKIGETISVVNFAKAFFELMGRDSSWDRTEFKPDQLGVDVQTLPDVRVKVVTNGNTASFYISDLKNEITQFTENDRLKGDERLSREAIKDKLKKKNVPYVRLLKANAFITSAEFGVTNDEMLKAILIKRYNAPTREQLVSEPTAERKKGAPSPQQLIYSSAIHGDIEMIGNFAFDNFAMIWLDFDVRTWNGPFYVMEREDVVERGSFTTRVNVRSTGADPLNTQGRLELPHPAEVQPPDVPTKKQTRTGKSRSVPK